MGSCACAIGMYLRVTKRRNRDGSSVAYYALAENVWNPRAKRSEAQVIHNFGRADQLDKTALQRLIASIQRVIDADAVGTLPTSGKASLPDIEIDAVFELGVVLAARVIWEELGIGEAIRTRLMRAHLSAPHEMALFAMAAQRLDDPGSKLSCAPRWLPDIAWLPQAGRRAALSRARLPGRLVRGDRARRVPAQRRPAAPRCRPDLLRHHHRLFRNRRAGRAPRAVGWQAVRAAAPAGPQGGPRQPAAGDHRHDDHS